MIIKLSPQVVELKKLAYDIVDSQVLEVSEYRVGEVINGNIYKKETPELMNTDIFDFTDMPNGELEFYDAEGNSLIETVLDEVPILNAKKENGVLTVEILFTIDIHEKDERLLFPEPMSLNEFNDLMAELEERGKVVEDEPVDVVEEDSDDSLEETDDLVDPDEVVEDDRDETESIDIEEVDF